MTSQTGRQQYADEGGVQSQRYQDERALADLTVSELQRDLQRVEDQTRTAQQDANNARQGAQQAESAAQQAQNEAQQANQRAQGAQERADQANQQAALRARIADEHPHDREAYTEAKADHSLGLT